MNSPRPCIAPMPSTILPTSPASTMSDAPTIHEVPPAQWVDVLATLPRRLYADDPQWVGLPRLWQRSRLNPSSATFRTTELVVFAAHRHGDLVGTISVLRDSHFDIDPSGKIAWFGHFECVNDVEVAAALVDVAAERAKTWGATTLRGGRDLSRFEFVGITVEGHDRLPPMLQGQHKAYYAQLLEGQGFTPHHDVLAYERKLWLEDGSPAPIPEQLLRKAATCTLDDLVVRPLRYRSLESDLRAAHSVLNEAYATVPDIRPMPLATFLAMGRAIALLSKRELIQLAFIGDRPVAFTMCIPEINEALVHARGRLLSRGGLKALMAWRHIQTAAFKLIGVVPDLRGSGLHARMIVEVVHSARKAGFTRVDGSVIDERNLPMRGVVEGAGMHVYRRYRFYNLAL